jgi:ADP-ribose pyrophosphatase YjhB (NUDIX family)
VSAARVGVEVTVCVALHREGRWLLSVRGDQADHAPNSIGLVGGHLELPTLINSVGEPALLEPHTLENNARREVLEETGIELAAVELTYLDSELFRSDRGYPVLAVTFVAEVPAGAEPRVAAPEEISDVGWWTTPELETDPRCPPWTLRLCTDAAALLARRQGRP